MTATQVNAKYGSVHNEQVTQTIVVEIIQEEERLSDSQFDPEPKQDRLQDDICKKYCTDTEGPNQIAGKFQKRFSSREVIRPSKLNL